MRLLPKISTRRWVLIGILTLAAAAIAAPYLSAEAFGDRIRLAMEQALHRKVRISEVRFSLLRGPGFSLRDVVIQEDPSVGVEPFAYVNSIDARVSLLGLLRGKLEFSSLRLVEPSVNLVKTESGAWNFQTLLGSSPGRSFPAVSMDDGRLNFTLNGVKSVFYFSLVDMDLSPPRSAGGGVTVDFSGDPTRSDRTARGFGTIRGKGRWRPSAEPGGTLDLEVTLERTSLGEVATLMHGYDIGIHGQAAGRATFRGPLSALAVDSTLELTDLHRWDLLPPYAEGGPLRLRGTLNLPGQVIDVETVPNSRSTLGVRVRASDYLARPRWVVGATLNGFPVAPLGEISRHMGIALGPQDRLDGTVSGAVVYSPDDGLKGSLLVSDFALNSSGRSALKAATATLLFEGDRTAMPPAAVKVGDDGQATLRFDYSLARRQIDLRVDCQRMGLASLAPEAGLLPGVPGPPFASAFRSGEWTGRLAYHRAEDAAGVWTGTIQLRNASAVLDGFAEPVQVASATAAIQKDGIRIERIEATAGGLEFRGEYSFRAGAARPEHISGRITRASLREIDRLLAPALHRPRGLLSRTLRLDRTSVPEWLADRRAQGSVEIGVLEAAGEAIESVRLDFYWDGPRLDVPHFTARALSGELRGHLAADFSAADPVLRVAGHLETSRWRGGALSGDGTLTTSGAGEALYRNLRAEGSFRAQHAALGPDTTVPQLAGSWTVSWEDRAPRLRLNDLRLVEDDDVYTGQGGTVAPDRVEADLARGERHVRLSGTLKPLALAKTEGR